MVRKTLDKVRKGLGEIKLVSETGPCIQDAKRCGVLELVLYLSKSRHADLQLFSREQVISKHGRWLVSSFNSQDPAAGQDMEIHSSSSEIRTEFQF